MASGVGTRLPFSGEVVSLAKMVSLFLDSVRFAPRNVSHRVSVVTGPNCIIFRRLARTYSTRPLQALNGRFLWLSGLYLGCFDEGQHACWASCAADNRQWRDDDEGAGGWQSANVF